MPQTLTWIGSCNKNTGRSGFRPEAVVIHIMDDDMATVDDWFNTPKGPHNTMPVSAHYGVGRTGKVHQYVQEMDTAWHAGRVFRSSWPLLKKGVSPNRYTIGIEHEGKPSQPWTDAMYEASATLLAGIAQRWSIPLDADHVIRHAQIFAEKSYCPGPHCDIAQLIDLAHHVALSGTETNFVSSTGTVTAVRNLNIRTGAPSSLAAVERVAPAGSSLPYVGFTSNGDSVHGNAHWYRDAQGNYFWAGATSAPSPM
jgi:N-acetylmuramoyl-L-alanine amidase